MLIGDGSGDDTLTGDDRANVLNAAGVRASFLKGSLEFVKADAQGLGQVLASTKTAAAPALPVSPIRPKAFIQVNQRGGCEGRYAQRQVRYQ